MTRPPRLPSARRQAGFIPGTVIEINVSIAILGVAVAVLLSWAEFALKPQLVEPKPAELVAPVAAAGAVAPQGWTVTQAPDKSVVIRREEPIGLRWIVPGLIAAAALCLFVFPLQPPFWILLAALCATWGYANTLAPVNQSITLAADGAVAVRGSARLAGFAGRSQSMTAKEMDAVLVHKERPEVYLVYFADKTTRRAWRVYAETPAEAQALAALVLRSRAPAAGRYRP